MRKTVNKHSCNKHLVKLFNITWKHTVIIEMNSNNYYFSAPSASDNASLLAQALSRTSFLTALLVYLISFFIVDAQLHIKHTEELRQQ